MITVRFASGLTVAYNGAYFVQRYGDGWILRDQEGGRAFAIAPPEAIVEWVAPCRIEEPGTQALARAANEPSLLKQLPLGVLRRLKIELMKFNRTTGCWKD